MRHLISKYRGEREWGAKLAKLGIIIEGQDRTSIHFGLLLMALYISYIYIGVKVFKKNFGNPGY